MVVVPEAWGHGVLNLQESIAVATEMKVLFRYALLTLTLARYHPCSPRLRMTLHPSQEIAVAMWHG